MGIPSIKKYTPKRQFADILPWVHDKFISLLHCSKIREFSLLALLQKKNCQWAGQQKVSVTFQIGSVRLSNSAALLLVLVFRAWSSLFAQLFLPYRFHRLFWVRSWGCRSKSRKEAQENILSRATPTFCATLTPSEKLWAKEPPRAFKIRYCARAVAVAARGAKLISLCGDAENPTAQEPSASIGDSPRVEWLNRITCCQSQLERDGSREHPLWNCYFHEICCSWIRSKVIEKT